MIGYCYGVMFAWLECIRVYQTKLLQLASVCDVPGWDLSPALRCVVTTWAQHALLVALCLPVALGSWGFLSSGSIVLGLCPAWVLEHRQCVWSRADGC